MSKDVYQSFWTLVIGESLLSEPKPDNPEDKYVACVKKKYNSWPFDTGDIW